MAKASWYRRLGAALLGLALLTGCAGGGGSSAPAPSSSPSEASQPEDESSAPSLIETMTGVNPLQDKNDPAANSGENGTLFLVNWPMIANETSDTVQQYDMLNFITALQGLVNREGPRLMVAFQGQTDNFWLKYLRREGKLLYGYKLETINSFDDFLAQYKDAIASFGLAAWDENVPATSNVALTVCGVDGCLPVRGGGEVARRIQQATGAEVKLDLVGMFTGSGSIPGTGEPSSGSAKCDAYLWAMHNYMDYTNNEIMGYLMDGMKWAGSTPYPDLGNAYVPNHDYLVMKKAFVFDLSPWPDEAPNDDPGQPVGTDYNTMKALLRRQYEKNNGEIFQICGFVPWHQKYTTHNGNSKTHDVVPSEWAYAEVISCYNGVMDAEAYAYCGISNASIYTQYKGQDQYENNRPAQTAEFDPSKTYGLIYMGDYDAAAWLKMRTPDLWTDPVRGEIPLAWGFNPNLSERVPMIFDYLYEYKTDNDFFVAGDSGAGYLNPYLLFNRKHSDLPAGDQAFIEHNQYYFEKFDLDITGFVINGAFPFDQQVKEMYTQFSPGGVIHNCPGSSFDVVDGTPFMPEASDIASIGTSANVSEAAQTIVSSLMNKDKYNFKMFRFILWTPSSIKAVLDTVEEKAPGRIEWVDPYTYMDLARQAWEYYN